MVISLRRKNQYEKTPPLYFDYYLQGAAATEMHGAGNISSISLQVPDSMELFQNITDIGRQIEMRIKPVGDSVVYRNPLDSLYSRKENGTLQLPDSFYNVDAMRGLTFRDTLFYNPLFLPMIFNGKMLPRDLSFYPPKKDEGTGLLIPPDKTFAPALQHADFIQNIRRDYYKKYPDRVKYSVFHFDSLPHIESDDEVVRETFNPFRELLKTETTYSLETPDVEVATFGRKYWVRSGEHSFQFAQNYFPKTGTREVLTI